MSIADDVTRAVEACNPRKVAELLLAVDEAQRRAAAPAAQRLYAASDKVMDARLEAAVVAVFGTGTPAQVVARGWLRDDDEHRQLARARPRAWAHELAERAPVRGWALIRGLVRDGLIDEPMTDAYVLGMISHDPWRRPGVQVPLLEWLREDRDLLETSLWRLFEVEGGGEDSLAAHDKYVGPDRSWGHALTTLADTGELDRQRLLDASLAALRRDWLPFRAQWMTAFHTGLAPTVEERAARAGDYAALLRAQAPAVVGFAVTALTQLQKAGRLDEALLLRSASPAVLARAKSTATAAVRLVARSAAANPRLAERVLADAQGSEHAEVRAAADKALAALTGQAAPARATRSTQVSIAPPPREQPAIGDLSLRKALLPVADLEDLAARLAAVLERADDPDELELVLDGLSRLCAEPGADHVLALIARRAAVIARRDGELLTTVVARVVDAWATRRPHAAAADVHSELRGSTRLQLLRLAALVDRLAARSAAPLAACPTHEGGWLDPAVLIKRLEDTPGPAEVELAVALLRLPTRPADTRLDQAVARVGDRRQLFRRQLSGAAVEAARAEEPALRFEVAAAPNTYRFLTVRPEGRVPLALNSEVPVFDDGSWVRWTGTVWPRGVRVRDAMAAELLAEGIDWSMWGAIALLEPLLDPQRPLLAEGCVLLALGLLCKESAQRRLAVDALIQAADDGRLRGPALADALALVLPATLPSRLMAALTEAARAGDTPALVARDALVGLLPRTDPARKGVPGLVGLLADLADTYGLPADEALQGWLTGRSGALAKQAKRLLPTA